MTRSMKIINSIYNIAGIGLKKGGFVDTMTADDEKITSMEVSELCYLFLKGNKFETPLFIVICLILLQYWSPQFKNKSMTTISRILSGNIFSISSFISPPALLICLGCPA